MFPWRPTRPSGTNTPKRCFYIIRDWNAKAGSQEIPGVTGKLGLGGQNEAGQRLPVLCQGNMLVRANTVFQQHKRWLYTWTWPDGQYWNQTDCIPCSRRLRSSIQSAKADLELTVAQIINSSLQKSDLNWRKQGKTTRLFRYDLNQIPHDSTVEVTNRFKGLDLIEAHIIIQEEVIKTILKKKKWKKAKWLSEEALQIAEKRNERQRLKGKIYSTECRVPKKSKES